MSKFITGKELEDAVYNIIWDAQETLLIVSPYIKLEKYFRELFDQHKNNPKLHIIIVFGKNEADIKRSLTKADFDYFKQFLKISIIHIPNLHAKYYGNETRGVITSINLHDFSFQHNIEYGVYDEITLLNSISKSVDSKAWDTSRELANKGDAVFIKRPMFEKKLFGKNYIKSEVLLDNTDSYYNLSLFKKPRQSRKLADFEDELEFGTTTNTRPQRKEVDAKTSEAAIKQKQQSGYCIRTGKSIPYNPSAPYSYEAFQSWAQWGNPDFPEKYCHKTGDPSKGKTTKNRPILY